MKHKIPLFVLLASLFLSVVVGCQNQSKENIFTITWQNWDGTILECDESVPFGALPTYDSETPTRISDERGSYTFDGWNPIIKPADSNQVYTACFDLQYAEYTVTWQNWDGTILLETQHYYGDWPVYPCANPERESDDQYEYKFSGWSPKINYVRGDTVYVAQFSCVTNDYYIYWQNWDGKTLERDKIPYGSMPTYDGEIPTRTEDARCTYTFSGWSPTVSIVRGNAVYTAQYEENIKEYTIVWRNWDGTILETDKNSPYGSMPTYDGATPTKSGSDQYSFVFSHWYPTVSAVSGNRTYNACFDQIVNTYTVTWMNWNGDVLDSETYQYGAIPQYKGELPSRQNTSNYNYSFVGWSPNIEQVTQDVTYLATFSSNVIDYLITYSLDGGTADNPNTYNCETNDIHLNEPIRDGYKFEGWTGSNGEIPETTVVIDCSQSCDLHFVANWSLETYSITYHLFDGTNNVNNPSSFTIESNLTLYDAVKAGYSFCGWYLDSGFTKKINGIQGQSNSLDIYAKFTANSYTLHFITNGGCLEHHIYFNTNGHGNAPETLVVGETTVITDYPIMENEDKYLFTGWYLEPQCENIFNFTCSIENDVTLYAGWYKIPDDSETTIRIRKYYPNKLENVLRDGVHVYSFYSQLMSDKNYYTYNEKYGYFASLTNLEILAKFQCAPENISGSDYPIHEFIIFDATSTDPDKRILRMSGGQKTLTLKAGHVYYYQYYLVTKRYDKDFVGTQKQSSCSFDITFAESSWDETDLIPDTNISFSEKNDLPVMYDEFIQLPSPKKDGYVFIGWFDENDNAFTDFVWLYENDIYLYAKWETEG